MKPRETAQVLEALHGTTVSLRHVQNAAIKHRGDVLGDDAQGMLDEVRCDVRCNHTVGRFLRNFGHDLGQKALAYLRAYARLPTFGVAAAHILRFR